MQHWRASVALTRLVRQGLLTRVDRGLYARPQQGACADPPPKMVYPPLRIVRFSGAAWPMRCGPMRCAPIWKACHECATPLSGCFIGSASRTTSTRYHAVRSGGATEATFRVLRSLPWR
ncbi:MAG: type IV toxin-antitoxin system AbiEi family antitoxin domain-containing protein [Gammaproteobacteria bacterium]